MIDEGWWRYVQRIAAPTMGKLRQKDAAAIAGVSEATVSRWAGGTSEPEPVHVVSLCRHFGRSPLEGFIAAGMLNAEEAGATVSVLSLEEADLMTLMGEISSRIDRLKRAADAGDLSDDLLLRTGISSSSELSQTPLADEADTPPAELTSRRRSKKTATA